MKKIFLIITLLFLSSCSYQIPDTESLRVPTNSNPPVSGLYQVEMSINEESGTINEEKREEYAAFSDNLIIILGDAAENPALRLRKVNLSDYLKKNFSTAADFLNLPDEDVVIMTVYGENKMPYELILRDNNNIIFYQKGEFLFLKKIKDKIDEKEAKRILKIQPEKDETAKAQKTGIFFGIRYPSKNGFKYETDYLYFEDKVLKHVLRDENIIIPSGRFLRIIPEENEIGRLIFKSEPISFKGSETPEELPGEITVPVIEKIEYAGRNYLTVEKTNLSDGKKELRTLNVRTPDSEVSMSLKDLFGKTSREILYYSDYSDTEGIFSEENFGIRRDEGKWKPVIRAENDGDPPYFDYIINMNLPEKIVKYDRNLFSREALISHFPDATDSFYSPKDDIIFIETANSIKAYPVENNQLVDQAIMQRNLLEGSAVVMVEWVNGIRAEESYKIFSENGGIEIEW